MDQELVGIAETARMLGVSRQRVHQIAGTNPEFPKPVAELAAGRIWRRQEVEAWIGAHPDRQKSGPKGRRSRRGAT
ncbi:MAG: helix-turn-helix transcriptional regulator [Candidatus Dormibacteria bacterium]